MYDRISENFYSLMLNEDVDETKHDYSLGLYLVNEHNSAGKEDFGPPFPTGRVL